VQEARTQRVLRLELVVKRQIQRERLNTLVVAGPLEIFARVERERVAEAEVPLVRSGVAKMVTFRQGGTRAADLVGLATEVLVWSGIMERGVQVLEAADRGLVQVMEDCTAEGVAAAVPKIVSIAQHLEMVRRAFLLLPIGRRFPR
jgi:hypothetical protein